MLQEEVYEACNLEALVDAALEGYSITLFAYGQVQFHLHQTPRRVTGPVGLAVGGEWRVCTESADRTRTQLGQRWACGRMLGRAGWPL